ncbi:BatA domain-containing protein [Rhodopirellula halodulae]|uniref:BatA domain-containing protein n=1 Tax=Rhodopirellula halodulae TaxID=2894198 RepID=UPI001E388D63|nr:BatA domain-containing protein [Rhodopirellula sp. JC737]MCC9656951.1 BatA domain-containing protein [Rhodopirellula sp. JC737]
MSFLQPWMLFALPIALLPIVIHLINQRRYQTTQWAAMMFLLAANRMNRGYAKIRQWAILALRTMVLLALIIAIGRPLASGSLGGGLIGSLSGGASANTIVLLDRSPSMSANAAGGARTKLEAGVAQIAETLDTLGVQRLWLIDSNTVLASETQAARELASPEELLEVPQTGPSDASADIPAMMLAALDTIQANSMGQTDVWICSDGQQTDWQARDGRWPSLREALAPLGRRVRFRLLSVSGSDQLNRSIRIDELQVRGEGDERELWISGKIQNSSSEEDPPDASKQSSSVRMDLAGAESIVELPLESASGEFSQVRVPLGSDQERGYGHVSLPADGNNADNTFYFAFDQPPPRRSVIVSENEEVAKVLSLAAGISSDASSEASAEVITTSEVPAIAWGETALILWQASLPTGAKHESTRQRLQGFLDRGGRVIFFPSENPNASDELFGVSYENWTKLGDDVTISSWRGENDLLGKTLAGMSLPVGKLVVRRLASMSGETTTLAKLSNDEPVLVRVPTEKGGVYFCGTTPVSLDSSLSSDGIVLYVMIQRALIAGAESLANTGRYDAGAVNVDAASNWRRVQGKKDALSTEHAFSAGVYADADRFNAINRSQAEDSPGRLSTDQVDELFQGLVLERVSQSGGETSSLVDEVWRAFLILMLIAMVGEAILCLPRRSAETASPKFGGITT